MHLTTTKGPAFQNKTKTNNFISNIIFGWWCSTVNFSFKKMPFYIWKTVVLKMDGWMNKICTLTCFAVCWLISRGHSLSGGNQSFSTFWFLPRHLHEFPLFSEWILLKNKNRAGKHHCGFYSAQRLWLKAVRFPCRAEGNSLEAKDLGSHWKLVPISRWQPVMSLVTSQEVIRRTLKEYKTGIIKDGWGWGGGGV